MSLQRVKHTVLAGLERAGVLRLVADSGWRQRRLLILCYHGISIDREHEWRPRLYMPADQLRSRLEMMRDGGYRVLPLIEAIWRLKRGDLPPRSVVLTFDDGATTSTPGRSRCSGSSVSPPPYICRLTTA